MVDEGLKGRKEIDESIVNIRLWRFYSFSFGRFSIRFLVLLMVLIRYFDSVFLLH